MLEHRNGERMVTNKTLSIWTVVIGVAAQVIATVGCSRYEVVPRDLREQVNKNIAFDEIEQSPSSYRGELIVLGGEILSATRLANKTRLEVLQLPLTDEYIPITEDRGRSKGRFYADDGGNEILDPAVLPKGTPVTVIGQITGKAKGTIGETEQDYPTLRIKDLTKWDKSEVRRWAYPYPYPYPYYGGYYWYGARPFGFRYW
jgi:outer membrane lipoprotein